MKQLILTLSIALILTSCSTTEKKSEQKSADIISEFPPELEAKVNSSLADVIYLEDNELSLLSNVSHVEITGDGIYVLDRNSLYKFDLTGKYIHKLNKGVGPGEIQFPVSFSILNDELALVDRGNTIHFYDLDLEFLRTIKLPFSAIDFIELENGNYMFNNGLPAKWEPALVLVYDVKSDSIVKKVKDKSDSPMADLSLFGHQNYVNHGGKSWYYHHSSREIFIVEALSLKSEIKINTAGMEPEKSLIEKFKRASQYRNHLKENKLAGPFLYHFPFKDFHLIGMDYLESDCLILFNNDQENAYQCNLNDLLDLPENRSFKYPLSTIENDLIFAYQADPEDNENLTICGEEVVIKNNENPVIVRVSIKKDSKFR